MGSYNTLNNKLKSEIKKLLKQKMTQKKIAFMLNVSPHSVFKVKNNIQVYKRGNLIQVSSVSDKLYNDLNNIADNLGVKFPSFMRSEFKKIAQNYPEKMKQKKPAN